MSRTRLWSLSALALLAGSPQPSIAAVTPVAASRQATVFAFLDWIPGEEPFREEQMSESVTSGAFSADLIADLALGGSQVTAIARQESEIGVDRVHGEIEFSVEGHISPPASAAIGICSTGLIYDFDLDTSTVCHLTFAVDAVDFAVFDVKLQLRDFTVVFARQFSETNENVELMPTLAPGAYQLIVGGGGDGGQSLQGSGRASGTMQFDVRFLEPAAVGGPEMPGIAPVISPNPARDRVNISFAQAVPLGTPAIVLAADGRRVRSLAVNGDGSATWDTRDEAGLMVPGGVYFVRVGKADAVRSVIVR